jgi:hypothetical protein
MGTEKRGTAPSPRGAFVSIRPVLNYGLVSKRNKPKAACVGCSSIRFCFYF